MKYTLIKNEKIVFGPQDWSSSSFSKALFDLGVSISLPTVPQEGIDNIIGGYKIYPTEVVDVSIAANQYISSYDFVMEKDIAYYTPILSTLSEDEIASKIANIKPGLFETLRLKRVAIEQGGLLIQVGDTPCIFDTDRDSQGMLHRTYSFMQEPVMWKLKDNFSWVLLSKNDMLYVIMNITKHISDCFIKEATLQAKIESLNIIDLAAFNVDTEWGAL